MSEDDLAAKHEARIKAKKEKIPKKTELILSGTRLPHEEAATLVDSIALQFAEEFETNFKHVKMWKSWHIWNGLHWEDDTTHTILREVRKFVRKIEKQINSRGEEDTKKACLVVMDNLRTIMTYSEADHRFATRTDRWDQDKWILNTTSGVVDLRTGQLRPGKPDDYCRKITSVGPADVGTPCPLFDAFLDKIFASNQELISFTWRELGYCLTGSVEEHAMFFNYGEGANGKGVMMNTIAGILGEYCTKASIETFMSSKSPQHLTFRADLDGPRLVLISETESGRYWNETFLCEITGGDPIVANRMRCDPYKFNPVCKIMISGNHRPKFKNVGEAIKRRMNLIPFDVVIPKQERDLDLADKLKAEWPAILRKMIDGCLEWQRIKLSQPDAVVSATREYLEEEDIVKQWMDDMCVLDYEIGEYGVMKTWTQMTELHRSFTHWILSNGETEKTLNHNEFGKRLAKINVKLKMHRSNKGNGFYGIRLRGHDSDVPFNAGAHENPFG